MREPKATQRGLEENRRPAWMWRDDKSVRERERERELERKRELERNRARES